MEELYSETYLKARPSQQRTMARIGLIALCFVLAFVDLFVLQYIPGLIVVLAVDIAIIYFLPSKDIAYEYVFVDGQIDFDCIIGGNKRKNKKRTDLEKIDLVAPENSPALNPYQNLPLSDYSSGNSGDKHFIAISRTEKGSERIKFTPDEKLIENMKFKGRSKIQC
ncbi:MAG TPA: hypothetical protein DCZ23_00690 [Lachnospiraceae bacterium]|nr:hypothetical protein [Lachnospiraceae bacterium]